MNILPPKNYSDQEMMRFIGQQESQDIICAPSLQDQIDTRLREGRTLRGDTLPWTDTHWKIRFGEGQVSLWAGFNGHMKSMLLGQVMMWMSQTVRVGIASFEMPVIDTMERMIRQAAGCAPSVQFGREWANWSDNKLFFYDQLDTVPPDRVLGVMYYMATELGVKHMLFDSLTKCGLPAGDRDAEKRFIDTISAAAKALKVHVHLVAHVRKPPSAVHNKIMIPNKYDVRGAGELTDLVDNVLIVWHDKKRAMLERLQAKNTLDDKELAYLEENPTHRLIVEKQRHGEWEGTIPLYFHKKSLQFSNYNVDKQLPFDVTEKPRCAHCDIEGADIPGHGVYFCTPEHEDIYRLELRKGEAEEAA